MSQKIDRTSLELRARQCVHQLEAVVDRLQAGTMSADDCADLERDLGRIFGWLLRWDYDSPRRP
jgi:hypothetical protein